MAAIWFGFLTGLVEGLGFVALQRLEWITVKTGLVDVSTDIIWFAVVFDVLLFALIGATLALITSLLAKQWVVKLAILVFALLTFFDWLTLVFFGRVQLYAIAVVALGLSVQATRLIVKNEVRLLKLWRPAVVSQALLALLLGLGSGFYESVQERRANDQLPPHKQGSPNVVLIVVDALRADHLSSYGYSRATSPNLDHLANEGVLFENAFSASSWTLPSHVSLFTGRYPTEHKADWSNPTALNDSDFPTLAEALQARGYRTAGFSGNLFWVTHQFGLARGFTHFEDYFHSWGDMAARTIYGRAIENAMQQFGFEDIPARRRATDINDSALKWVSQDPGKPFFLFINYMDVHDPYLPPQPNRQKFSTRNDPGGILNWRLGRSNPKLTSEQLEDEISAYDGAISYVDEQIGHLISGLNDRKLNGNTIFIVTSDHGEMFGVHNLYLHGHSLYRGEIHVPLIIRGANGIPAGVRVKQPVSNSFIATTVMSLIGVEDQMLFPNRSLSLLWNSDTSQTAAWPSPVSYIAQQSWVDSKLPVHHGAINSVIDEQWHYIENDKLGVELFRVQEDPLELNNLAKNPDVRDLIEAFRSDFKNGTAITISGHGSGKQSVSASH